MNRLAKTLILAIMLLALPLKQWGQNSRLIKLSEFNVHDIETIEERVFLIHTILEKGYYCYSNSEKPNTVDVFMSNDASDELSDFDFFYENFLYSELDEFRSLDKSMRGELFVQWRQELNDDLFRLLYDDFTRGIASENATCETALPFCTDNGAYTFPAGVNSGSPCGSNYNASCSAPYACSNTAGQSYNCLSTAPNPAFYYLKIASTGNLKIKIYSTPRYDIDFDCWGPFDDPATACNQLSCSNIVDCSYIGGSDDEFCHINNAVVGKYYILLLTNYGNHACNIIFENIGTGTTDCGIMPPLVENNGPYCVGETIYLTANGQAGASYSWSGPAGFSSTLQNPTRTNCTAAMSGTYTCTITVGSASNSATTEVEVRPQPTANFTATAVCQGNTTQFTNTSTTNPSGQSMTYQWNFGDGHTSTEQNPSYTFSTAGSHTVTLTVTSGEGLCTDTKTQTVTVYAEPVANAGPDQTIPLNNSTQLSGSGGAGTFNFHWEPANMVTNADAQNTQTVSLTQDQTYILTVTNPQGGCSSTDEVTVHIEGSALTASANAAPSSICQGGSTQLTANAGGGLGSSTYSWSPTTGLSNPNIYNPVATPTQTTTYTCTVHNAQTSQTATASVTVTVNAALEGDYYTTICDNEFPHTFHNVEFHAAGEQTITLPNATPQGCDSIVTLHVDIYPSYDENETIPIQEEICDGADYTFDVQGYHDTYTESVSIPYRLETIHGCDSIVRLNLTVWEDQSPIDTISIPICPDQLPYYYQEDPNHTPLTEGLHTLYLEDNHGCEKVVNINVEVSEYYIPPTETVYVGYYGDNPSYDWHIPEATGSPTITYTTEGLHTDTLQTSACEGIFTLDLHFRHIPDTVRIDTTVCNSFDWYVKGVHVGTYTNSDTKYYPIPLCHEPGNTNTQYMYFDPSHPDSPTPCFEHYMLNLTVNHESVDNNVRVDGIQDHICDVYYYNDPLIGDPIPFYEDTDGTPLSGHTSEGCDYLVNLKIENMQYTPVPDSIRPNSASTSWFGLPEDPDAPVHDTAMCSAVVTNTEFFSFQYTFYVKESVNEGHRKCVWEQCKWDISKPSWTIEFDPVPKRNPFDNMFYSECKVFVADRDDDYVRLTATIINGCGSEKQTIYLKSSFLDIDEYNNIPAEINIVPNPNNGQMRINFENMEGHTAVKVFDMTGNQIDAFETNINSNSYNYDYNMKRYADGIYFFVVANSHRTLTKKVVVIH